MKQLVRLNKRLSEAGICSRRQADKLIEEGRVEVNHETAVMGMKVSPEDIISINGKTIDENKEPEIVMAFYKPKGIVCTTSQKEKDNVIDYIGYPTRIYPVGRLDKNSEGLILLTNNGELTDQILRSRNNHEKEYIVRVNKPLKKEIVKAMEEGVPIFDTMTKPCKIKQHDEYEFSVILTQGLNRQIRRMCEYFEYRVTFLKRVRIINIQLNNLKKGEYRFIKNEELKKLKKALNIANQ
ncbi:MAG: pseudouridine synthase [Lachnoclostridium sp.]|jgi:23S rRNA pseudouridine2604 synthase|nr:pseudouridine synthase [Lachnoclostridium sp.]